LKHVPRVLAQVELDFNSVERIVEYLDVPQEAPLITEKRPPAYWPSSNGGIHIENLVVRYSENLPSVLKNLTFSVLPREKIGVVCISNVLLDHQLNDNDRLEGPDPVSSGIFDNRYDP
jgi:ABC-type multidrug transport system fused ATPase/permease subunit